MPGLYDTTYLGRNEGGFDQAIISPNPEALNVRDRLLGAFQNLHTYFYGNEVNFQQVSSSVYPDLTETVDLTFGPAYLDELMSTRLQVMGMVGEQLHRTQQLNDLVPTYEEIPTLEGIIEIYKSNIPGRLNSTSFLKDEWVSLDSNTKSELLLEATTVSRELNEYFAQFRNGDFRVLYTLPNRSIYGEVIGRRVLVDCAFTSYDILAAVISRRTQFEQLVKSADARIKMKGRMLEFQSDRKRILRGLHWLKHLA